MQTTDNVTTRFEGAPAGRPEALKALASAPVQDQTARAGAGGSSKRSGVPQLRLRADTRDSSCFKASRP